MSSSGSDDDFADDIAESFGKERTLVLPAWVYRYGSTARAFFSNPTAFIIAILTVGVISYPEARNRLAAGESPLEILFEQFLFVNILFPAGVAVWNSITSTVNAVAIIILGSDYVPGPVDGGQAGIVDLPFIFIVPLANGIIGFGLEVSGAINSFNMTIAAQVTPLGLPAPVIVGVLWVAEIGVLLRATWTAATLLPFSVTDVLKSATAPLRNFIRGLT